MTEKNTDSIKKKEAKEEKAEIVVEEETKSENSEEESDKEKKDATIMGKLLSEIPNPPGVGDLIEGRVIDID